MGETRTVLITGASGNLGNKLRRHLQGRADAVHPIERRLLDRKPKGKLPIVLADLSTWDEEWADLFEGVDTIVHLAANAVSSRRWEALIGPNVDALIHVFAAAGRANVKRIVYASSCAHVMGGYKERQRPERLTTDLLPCPGAHWVENGRQCDSIPYATAKLMGERLSKCYAESRGLSAIVVRLGMVAPGTNRAEAIPSETDPWFRQSWLSNRDYCQLMARCVEATPSIRFAIVNGVSANAGMRWDIAYTRDLLGYEPLDDVTQPNRRTHPHPATP